MEIETINGIINVDLNTVTLNDVSDIISKMSVDAGVPENAVTILYSGNMCGYSTNDIVKELNSDSSKYLELQI